MLAMALGAALGACDPPSPSLKLRLSAGPSQPCPSTKCDAVAMACKTYVSIRFLDPGQPTAPYLSQCQEVPQDRKKDVCSVASVDLEVKSIPLRTLEVQVALYPENLIEFDQLTGEPICPTDIQYDAINGFPVDADVTPALGGRTFYHPGDDTILVTLGCTDLTAINDPSCMGAEVTQVRATIDDFDVRTGSVGLAFARGLSVTVGEPHPFNTEIVLNPADTFPLDLIESSTSPSWSASVDHTFTTTTCLAVLDDAPQSTTALTCQDPPATGMPLEVAGMVLSNQVLDQVLAALGRTQFPAQGLTVGIVLDANSETVPNVAVNLPTGTGTVQYLSADRTTVGGTRTTGSGIFVSTDAPFGTPFAAMVMAPVRSARAIAGLVRGKVTLAILQFKDGVVTPQTIQFLDPPGSRALHPF